MLRFTLYRLLWLIPTLLAMALVTFLVMHATPGSPDWDAARAQSEELERSYMTRLNRILARSAARGGRTRRSADREP